MLQQRQPNETLEKRYLLVVNIWAQNERYVLSASGNAWKVSDIAPLIKAGALSVRGALPDDELAFLAEQRKRRRRGLGVDVEDIVYLNPKV